MLQDFRDNLKGITAGFLVAIMIIPFAFFGIDSLFLQGSGEKNVAEVNGEPISKFRLDQAIVLRKRQILQQFEDVDPSLIDDEQLREPVIEAIIRQLALAQVARSTKMGLSESTFQEIVFNAQAFQREGRFDKGLYEFSLGQMGYTPKTYRQRVEEELLATQLVLGVAGSGFVADNELVAFADVTLQERNFYYLTIPLSKFSERVVVSDADVTGYYEENIDEFNEPEKLIIESITISPTTLASKIQVDDSLIRDQFTREQQEAVSSDSWHVAHILLEDNPERLDTIKEKLAQGEIFGALAKEYSEDFGSSEQEGDLGTFTSGTFPENFEEVIVALNVGEVSEVVQTSSGYHLIKLIDKVESKSLNYDDHKVRIRQQLVQEMALENLPGYLEELKEKSYNAATLKMVADELNLSVSVSESFTKLGRNAEGLSPEVVNAAFSDNVLKKGYASEVLELGENQYIVVKLKEAIPAHRKALSVVRSDIISQLKAIKAQLLVAEEGILLLNRIGGGEKVEDVAIEKDYLWQVSLDTTRFSQQVNPSLVSAVFQHAFNSPLPVTGKINLLNGDLSIYSLTEITAGSVDQISANDQRNLRYSLEELISSRELMAYEKGVLARSEIIR